MTITERIISERQKNLLFFLRIISLASVVALDNIACSNMRAYCI